MTSSFDGQPNSPKAQHYLPQFYLRGFGHRSEVLVRRRSGGVFSTGTAVVGHENFLYEHPGLPAGAVETDYLKDLDARASRAISLILSEGPPSKVSEDRSMLAHFLAVQHTRTPERREQMSWRARLREYLGGRELTRDFVRDYLREKHLGFYPSDSEVDAAYDLATYLGIDTDDDDRWLFLQHIVEPPKDLVEMLQLMDWTLETARKPRFITSDSPLVVWREPTPRDEFEGVGVANAEEVRFPIDAAHQLVLTQPSQGDGAREVEPQRVRDCNQDMALGCHRFIVGHPNRGVQLSRLELPEHRPVIRFNKGPKVVKGPDGELQETGEEILHTWLPRR